MKRKLRVGLIGTGVAARKLYAPAFEQLKKVQIVGCTNRSLNKAVAFAELAGIRRIFEDADALIGSPDVDAVFVSLPIAAQPEIVQRVLAAGKPVLSEKPVGASVAEARKLIKACQRRKVPWLVGENFEFMPHLARLKQWLEAGRIGDVRVVECRQLTVMDKRNPYFSTPWRADPKHLAGFISDGGVHLARIVRRCFGMPRVERALQVAFDPALPPFDTVAALLRFDAAGESPSPVGTWLSCFTAHYRGPLLAVHGTRGTAEFHFDRCILKPSKGRVVEFVSSKSSFALQLDHFAEVVGGAPSRATPEEALADLELIDRLCR